MYVLVLGRGIMYNIISGLKHVILFTLHDPAYMKNQYVFVCNIKSIPFVRACMTNVIICIALVIELYIYIQKKKVN